jgi:hypothetical protein
LGTGFHFGKIRSTRRSSTTLPGSPKCSRRRCSGGFDTHSPRAKDPVIIRASLAVVVAVAAAAAVVAGVVAEN